MGNCRCDLASHLAQALRTIHVVMAMMRAMAVMVMRVFNIAVIAVLILRRAGRLKVLHDVPGHHTEDRNQHKGNHWGDYLASIRVSRNSSRVQITTIAISMMIFKSCRRE